MRFWKQLIGFSLAAFAKEYSLPKQGDLRMHAGQAEKLTLQMASLAISEVDAPLLIAKLDSLDIQGDIILLPGTISIPKRAIKDLSVFQDELSILSRVGKAYKIWEENDRILIDTVTSFKDYVYSKEYLLHGVDFSSHLLKDLRPILYNIPKTTLPSSDDTCDAAEPGQEDEDKEICSYNGLNPSIPLAMISNDSRSISKKP